jgi:hypothetical protein
MHAPRLTVSYQYPQSCAARPRYLPTVPMLFLRLRGRWLDEAGFAASWLVLKVIDLQPAQR